VTLGQGDLFPADLVAPRLKSAVYDGASGDPNDSAILWQSSPPLVIWKVAAEPGRSGIIRFTYTSASCSGTGSGTLPVASN
jgi:hypothetical protein